MPNKLDFIQQAEAIKDYLIQTRNHIHSNPELSFEEYNTANFVETELQKLGLETKRIGNTGVVSMINGENPNGKVVALRADMDALPIVEVSDGRPYRSKIEGVMHACGHDVHTTSLLGAANILSKNTQNFKGKIKLIFQPAEEKLPGGASILIKEGVLENPKVDCIIGQHVLPQMHTGFVGFRPGLYMASTDEIYITIKGVGGHGAMPQICTDPVSIAAQLIVTLQQVVSRKATPIIPSVLSFGKIIGNGATNIIPNEVNIEGTFRTLDENWREEALQWIELMSKSVVEGLGAELQLEIKRGYPFLKNNETLTNLCIDAANDYLGKENVKALDIWMAAEDFSYYSHEVPSCFYRLGVRNEDKNMVYGVHHPAFDADSESFTTGAGLMAWLAVKALEN